MTAANTDYQTVRRSEMLPHHDEDTTTTPNSWKPKGTAQTPVSYAAGAANTLAEVTAGDGKAVDFGSTPWLTTNGSVEAGAPGWRNPDGTLGYGSSRTLLTTPGTIPVDRNGGIFVMVGGGFTVPVRGREGQIIHLYQAGSQDGTVYEHDTATMIGLTRDADNSIQNVSSTTKLRMRAGEVITLFGSGNGNWGVMHHSIKHAWGRSPDANQDGAYRELPDGTHDFHIHGVIPAGQTTVDLLFPKPIASPLYDQKPRVGVVITPLTSSLASIDANDFYWNLAGPLRNDLTKINVGVKNAVSVGTGVRVSVLGVYVA